MRNQTSLLCYLRLVLLAVMASGLSLLVASQARGQNPEMQQNVAEIKQSLQLNKQALTLYTWQQQETISVKGEVKKTDLSQVRIGPDGQQQKTDLEPDQSTGGRRHGIRHRITEDYENYGKQVAALGQSYAQPDPGKLQQMFDQGNVLLGSAGAPGELKVVINGYLKQGDSVTIIFNKAQQAIQSLQINSYLNDPQDVVTISAQYAQLPDGPHHVASIEVNGVSKHLTVVLQNNNYQKL